MSLQVPVHKRSNSSPATFNREYADAHPRVSTSSSASSTLSESAGPHWLPADVGVAQAQVRGEDTYDVKRIDVGGERLVLTLVADGEHGKCVSNHCASTVLRQIERNIASDPSLESVRGACTRAIQQIHDEVCLKMSWRAASASTLTVLVLNQSRREYVLANVGNSHAVRVHADGGRIDLLTEDRLVYAPPARATEAKPKAAAGRKKVKPLRATRLRKASFVGENIFEGSSVAPQPSVTCGSVPAAGICLIIATDGFWEVMRSERTLTAARSKSASAADIARNAVKTCRSMQTHPGTDDATCMVVSFKPTAARPDAKPSPKLKGFGSSMRTLLTMPGSSSTHLGSDVSVSGSADDSDEAESAASEAVTTRGGGGGSGGAAGLRVEAEPAGPWWRLAAAH